MVSFIQSAVSHGPLTSTVLLYQRTDLSPSHHAYQSFPSSIFLTYLPKWENESGDLHGHGICGCDEQHLNPHIIFPMCTSPFLLSKSEFNWQTQIPFHANWTNWEYKVAPIKCIDQQAVVFSGAGFSILHDIIIIIIPLPALWRLRLDTSKKLDMIFMFSVGILVVICTVLRIPALKTLDNSSDPSCKPFHNHLILIRLLARQILTIPQGANQASRYTPDLKVA